MLVVLMSCLVLYLLERSMVGVYVVGVYGWGIWLGYMVGVCGWGIWLGYMDGVCGWGIWLGYM